MKYLIIFCILISAHTNAQWQPDVRLTNNPGYSFTSYNNAWCIAAGGNNVHVVWVDQRDGNGGEIYYKRSTDEGTTWESDVRLTIDLAISFAPSVAVSGQSVHVVWYDERDGNQEIYYKRSTDGGISWGFDTRLTNENTSSLYPSLAVSGQIVHIVWYDLRNFNEEVYYKRSSDGGASWGADSRLTNDPSSGCYLPSISLSGSNVHVSWENGDPVNPEIYYMNSTDGGTNWGPVTRLTNDPADSYNACVAVSGNSVHVVWWDMRDGNKEIYCKNSSNGGLSWGADIRLTNNPANSENPSVSVSGQSVHVSWFDTRDGNTEIYYKYSSDGGINWGSDIRLTNNSEGSGRPSVSVSGSKVHVLWYDFRDGGDPEIYYKRNPTGNPIGIINVNEEIPTAFSLFQNYPNPFNPVTNINFSIPKTGIVKLVVYDAIGKKVSELVNGNYNAGSYKVDFNASFLSSGVYFYKIEAEGFTEVKKMILVK
jgi:hypothetical protein